MGRPSKSHRNLCPTMRPTREQFETKDFVTYVREVFQKNPDLPMFKVIPPRGYKARKGGYDLSNVMIQTPIKQHAFGKGGAFMCILEEQKPMAALEFKEKVTAPTSMPPQRGDSADDMLERKFWSSLSFNPPLYGADTPVSLFDDKLPWGWNLRHINCLFKDYDVPKITGVTTPMTYFGSWRSFFGWHKEDCDLMSVNYHHLGAPKIWYCVSPKDAAKFDSMAAQLFPQAAKACPAFVRHKDIVISPKVLRDFGIPYTQAKQNPGDFIVLNAAAYHTGFNLGFNAAEAVNFAVPEWMEVGRDSEQCECGCLPDGVQLDMSIFFPGLYDSETDSDEEFYDASEELITDDDEEESSSDEEEEEMQPGGRRRRRKNPKYFEDEVSSKKKKKNRGVKLPEAKRLKRRHDVTPEPEPEPVVHVPVPRTPRVPELPKLSKPIVLPPGASHVNWGPVADLSPMALITKDPETRELSFELVHRLNKKGNKPGGVWIGTLKMDADGFYRPSGGPKQEIMGWNYPKLLRVRTEWNGAAGRKRGGWKLTTNEKRILM